MADGSLCTLSLFRNVDNALAQRQFLCALHHGTDGLPSALDFSNFSRGGRSRRVGEDVACHGGSDAAFHGVKESVYIYYPLDAMCSSLPLRQAFGTSLGVWGSGDVALRALFAPSSDVGRCSFGQAGKVGCSFSADGTLCARPPRRGDRC